MKIQLICSHSQNVVQVQATDRDKHNRTHNTDKEEKLAKTHIH